MSSWDRRRIHAKVHQLVLAGRLTRGGDIFRLQCIGIMKELAQEYGFQYETVTADIDEQALGDRMSDPAELVTLLARAKAQAIKERLANEHGLLLTCDQVVIHQGLIREKPISEQQVPLKPLLNVHDMLYVPVTAVQNGM